MREKDEPTAGLEPGQRKFNCHHCQQPAVAGPEAPHKRFCSEDCRVNWHKAERKRFQEWKYKLAAEKAK